MGCQNIDTNIFDQALIGRALASAKTSPRLPLWTSPPLATQDKVCIREPAGSIGGRSERVGLAHGKWAVRAAWEAGSGPERVHMSVWISLADFDSSIRHGACSAGRVRWGGENVGCYHARLALGVTSRHAPDAHAGRPTSSSTARGAERALWSLCEGHGAVRAAIYGGLGARTHLPTINGCTCALPA